ncbi:MAG TPA: homoserine kinase [Trueperaceae bacterium]|nr:homoserine kinase [Trueperaceae bacterium]
MLRARVPASSANLGPGFDALGLAVGLYLEVVAQPAEADGFEYRGQGPAPGAGDNLIHHGFKAVHEAIGRPAPRVSFTVDNAIPLARGLGSSSAALVAGAAIADALLGEPLGRDGVFRLTARLEGHPDNVGPAVYGGFTVAAADETGRFLATSLPVPDRWCLLFGVPAFELPTVAARAVLPDSYTPSQVVLTASRAALWVAAVAQDRPELLRAASLDVLHQPFRSRLVPGLTEVLSAAREAGAHASFLSGSGPTVGVIADEAAMDACRAVVKVFVADEGKVLEPRTATGYVVERW